MIASIIEKHMMFLLDNFTGIQKEEKKIELESEQLESEITDDIIPDEGVVTQLNNDYDSEQFERRKSSLYEMIVKEEFKES